MTDEERARDLLTRAAELPDSVQPPLQRLLERGHVKRARRAALAFGTVAAGIAAAISLPLAFAGLGTAHAPAATRTQHRSSPPLTGPTSAQIARSRWSARPASPLGPRSQPLLTWTGKELIELGGPARGGSGYGGAAFSPATDTWHRIAPVPGTIGLANAATAWTGHQLFVTNGLIPPSGWPAGLGAPAGLYDLATNRWTSVLLPRQMEGITQVAAVWTGRDIVVAAVASGQLKAAALDPATRHWTMLSPVLPPGHPCRFIDMVATSDRVILWSSWDRTRKEGKSSFQIYSGVDVLALGQAGRWSILRGTGWPQHQAIATPTFTGDAILVSPGQIWCGEACSPPYASLPGFLADPTTLHRTAIPPGPIGQVGPEYIWTGRDVIAIDLSGETSGPHGRQIRPDDMALYDPQTGKWQRLAALPGYPGLAAPPLWTGIELLALTDGGQLWSFHG